MSEQYYVSISVLFDEKNITYVDNKYFKWYCNIIHNCIQRKCPQLYEKHHIIPKSIFPNEYTVCLTPREHFICHLLLIRFLKGKNRYKMLCAVQVMKHHAYSYKTTNRLYEQAKIEKNKMGMPDEMRKRLSSLIKGKSYEERHGPIKAAEIKSKMSKKQKGKKRDKDFIRMLQNRKYSDQHRAKISQSQLGEKNSNFKGYYHTPFDVFPSLEGQQLINPTTLRRICINNDLILSRKSYTRSKYLNQLNEDDIGKTYKELGFWFEPKT